MRPLIGIPCFAAERADSHRPIYGNNQSYVRAIEAAGGAPVLIPLDLSAESLAAIRERLDGLLLSGGEDIDPSLYGEEPAPQLGELEPERDALELDLTHWALDNALPVFGICRGMQTLNVARGGSLYQDIVTQRPEATSHREVSQPRGQPVHGMTVAPDSRLAAILGSAELRVNSLHHQALKEPGAGISVVAWSEDGLAEGVEMEGYPFVLAVQYHPEEMVETDEASRRLFAAFVQACQERRR